MISIIKERIWNIIKDKEVSLVMFCDNSGEILWHRGRKIYGSSVISGNGFFRNLILETLKTRKKLLKKDLILNLRDDGISKLPKLIQITNLMIIPILDRYYLYVDTTSNGYFKREDQSLFENLGALLGDAIEMIKLKEKDIDGISGDSEKIKNIRELVLKYSIEEGPVLLIGETGTGKNHVAELIHRYSGRKGKFIVVNTPSIPESLFESELFGYLKGAFTGADRKREGLILLAEGGTIFFDEISEVPLSFQAKLLQFIDTRRYRMLGDLTERKANVRIVSATNRNLMDEIQYRHLREDLYFRLSVLPIEIPPLRDRKEDINSIVAEHLADLRGKKLSNDFWEVMYNYEWPGNVRELIHVIKRAGIQLEGPVIGSEIGHIIQYSSKGNGFRTNGRIERIWEKMKSGESFWEVVKKPFLDRDLNRAEVKRIISRGLKESGGKYKNLLPLFNIHSNSKNYKIFMRFLYDNRLQ
jgi:transcriptional regulator with PAS, ATPase and Fis domain